VKFMARLRLTKKGVVSFVSACVIALGAGCTRMQEVSPVRIPFVEAKPEVTVSRRLTAEPPRTVAILPFGPLAQPASKKTDGRAILRSTFSSYFKALPFVCMHPEEVDRILEKNGLTDIAQINNASAATLGPLLHVDAVIYGDIKSAINFTGGVYSITELNGTLRMVDVKSGDVLWKCKYFEKAIGGVISPDSGELVSIIESQIENAKASLAYTRCADAFSRKVLQTLPDVTVIAPALPLIATVEIRPADRKIFTLFDTVEVIMKGDKGQPAFFDIGTLKENVPMSEISPGVYRGTYLVSRGDAAEDVCIVGKLGVSGLERQSVLPGSDHISIVARPPDQPKNLTCKTTDDKEVVLAWDPSESGSPVAYEIYRAPGDTFRYVCVGTTDRLSYADTGVLLEPLPEKVFYQVIARDAYDNKSDPSEPLKVQLKQ